VHHPLAVPTLIGPARHRSSWWRVCRAGLIAPPTQIDTLSCSGRMSSSLSWADSRPSPGWAFAPCVRG